MARVKDKRAFSDFQIVDQSLYFCGQQAGACCSSLRALTNKIDWIPVKELVPAGMMEKHGSNSTR